MKAHKCKRVFRLGSDKIDIWFDNITFRANAMLRCDHIAARFGCPVELMNEKEGVLYKVFP